MLRLQDAVLDRALNGIDMPVVAYGEVVASYKQYDNRLAAFILRNHLPEQYGAEGGRAPHAIDARKLTRLTGITAGQRPPASKLPFSGKRRFDACGYSSPIRKAAMKASCGMLTLLPAFAGTGRLRRSRIQNEVTLRPCVARR